MINKACLIIVKDSGNEELEISKGEFVMGRDYDGSRADIKINGDDGYISRYHCKIYHDGEKIEIEDTNSTNGISINGSKIDKGKRFVLNDKDKLSLGNCKLEVKIIKELELVK